MLQGLLDGGIEGAVARDRRACDSASTQRRVGLDRLARSPAAAQTSAGSAPSAAQMRRAARRRRRAPKSPSAAISSGRSSTLAMILSQASRARAAADGERAVEVGAGVLQHALAVGEGEGDAFHHRLGQVAPVGRLREADEGAAGRGVVVRRALAGEVGQERARPPAPRPGRPRRRARPASCRRCAASHSRLSAAERITPIWCQVSGIAWQKACTAPAVLGEKRSLETKSTPEVPSETKAVPGATAPTPQAAAALSPAPPATTDRPAHAPARGELGQELARRLRCPRRAAASARGDRPVAASRSSDQSRAATSSQNVPAASDMSETWSPVRRQADVVLGQQHRRRSCAKISGSCLRTQTSFGAVKPGIAMLPVISRARGKAASISAHSAWRGRRSRGCRAEHLVVVVEADRAVHLAGEADAAQAGEAVLAGERADRCLDAPATSPPDPARTSPDAAARRVRLWLAWPISRWSRSKSTALTDDVPMSMPR